MNMKDFMYMIYVAVMFKESGFGVYQQIHFNHAYPRVVLPTKQLETLLDIIRKTTKIL